MSRQARWFLCLRFLKGKMKRSEGLSSYLEDLGEILLPSHSGGWQNSNLALVGQRSSFPYWLPPEVILSFWRPLSFHGQ